MCNTVGFDQYIRSTYSLNIPSSPLRILMFSSSHQPINPPTNPLTGPHLLWGLVQVCLHARLLTAPGKEIIISVNNGSLDPSLTCEEVTGACTSDDVDLRLAALTLLTASQRTR